MFREELSKDNILFVILEHDKNIAGFGQGIVENSYGGKMGLIDKVYLNKNYLGMGLGKKLPNILCKK